jgi:putative hydrolase of the HAD superfamily
VPFRAVLLDLYDTFAWTDWEPMRAALGNRLGLDAALLARAFRETRAARNVGAHDDAAGDWEAVLEWAGVDAPTSVAIDAASLEHELLRDAVHLYPESLEVVAELRERGVKTALVSNCSHSTRPIVDRLGLSETFDAVILSFEVGARKPQPEIYRAALAAVGDVEPSEAVFVDDQAGYCDGAAALGIRSFLIARGNEPEEEPGGEHERLSDLTSLLQRI